MLTTLNAFNACRRCSYLRTRQRDVIMLVFVFVFGVVLPTLVTVACFVGFLVCWFHFRSRRRALLKKCGSRSRVHITVPIRPTAVVNDPGNGLPPHTMCTGCRIFIDPNVRPARSRGGSVQSGRLLLTPPLSPHPHLSPAAESTAGSEGLSALDEKHHTLHHQALASTRPACGRRTQYVLPPHRQRQITSGTTVVEVHNGIGHSDDDNGYVLTEFIRPTLTYDYEARSSGLSDIDVPPSLSVYDAATSAAGSSSYESSYLPTSSDDIVNLAEMLSCESVDKPIQRVGGGVRCTVVVRGGATSAMTGSVKSSNSSRRSSMTGNVTTLAKDFYDVSKSLASLPSSRRGRQRTSPHALDDFGYVDVEQIERHIRLEVADLKRDQVPTSTFSCSMTEVGDADVVLAKYSNALDDVSDTKSPTSFAPPRLDSVAKARVT